MARPAALRVLINPLLPLFESLKLEVQLVRILARFPTLDIQRPSIWRVDTLRALEIGSGVSVGPYTEIIAYHHSIRSSVAGKLVMGDGSIVTACCNIRAAGGVITIGRNSGVGQGSIVVASSHTIGPNVLRAAWRTDKTGVTIGENVWVGAGCVLLPGVTIGDNAMIAAGSVVARSVPRDEIWGGVPARLLRAVDDRGSKP